MKNWKRLAAVALTLMLVASLFVGCFGGEEQQEEEPDNRNYATAGGSISWPEGFDTTQSLNTTQQGDTLYMAFNNIQNRTSGYFTPAGDTLTIVGQTTTESENRTTYRVTLWKEATGAREYVDGGTLYLTADGSCYTGTFTGLESGSRYKIGISYDGVNYKISGGITVSGLVDNSVEPPKEDQK